MKNSTTTTTTGLTGKYDPAQDRSQITLTSYPAAEQRIKLKWIGPDPMRYQGQDLATEKVQNAGKNCQNLAERFVKNCADILCTIDAEGRFINVSVASQLILGYSPQEMEGRWIGDFILAQDLDQTMQAKEDIVGGTDFTNYENRYISKDGKVVNMAWSARWCAEDALIYCVGRDDSQKKAVELELHKLNESLEIKIQQRTAQLEQSNKELEAFSYSVSHDLRAPLRIINGYARLLSGDYRKNADPESIEFLDAIIESTQYMGRLIDDLLNLSKMDKEAVNKSEVNMDFLSRLIVSKMQAEDASITSEIVIHQLKPAYCDSALIRQVWINLLSNAVKYSKKTQSPKIEVGSYETDTNVVYYVKDNGAGFDMKFAAKLFGVFVRLHNRTEFEGTGVGLALVHRIITKHGGKVWANGKVDEGAIFYFSLPKEAVS